MWLEHAEQFGDLARIGPQRGHGGGLVQGGCQMLVHGLVQHH